MVSFTGHYNAISLDRLASKSKTGKGSWKRYRKIILFYVSLCFPQLQRLLFLYQNHKKAHYSASDWWEHTIYHFKENTKIPSKNSTTQANITISRKNCFFYQKHKKQPLQQVPGKETPNLVLKGMLERFLKVSPLKKN